jgi:hypothetical protein
VVRRAQGNEQRLAAWLRRGEDHFRRHVVDPATDQYFVFARRLRAFMGSEGAPGA